MAEDNKHISVSKTSPWENELCQAAREAASGQLDRDEDVLAAVATDYCLIVLTDRNLRTIDTSKSKILLTWPLAEMKNLRVDRRSGGTWLSFETTQGEHRKESLVGEWALFGDAVDEFLTSGRVASDSNFTQTPTPATGSRMSRKAYTVYSGDRRVVVVDAPSPDAVEKLIDRHMCDNDACQHCSAYRFTKGATGGFSPLKLDADGKFKRTGITYLILSPLLWFMLRKVPFEPSNVYWGHP